MAARIESTKRAQRRWMQVSAISKMVELHAEVRGRRLEERPHELVRSMASTLAVVKEDIEHMVDFDGASMFSHEEEFEHYADIFTSRASSSGGQLTRQGFQRAMRDAGVVAQSVAEQRKFKKVQAQVLEYCRGQERLEDSKNPLANAKGVWELEEFLMMVAGMQQLDRRAQWKVNKAVADELGLSAEALEEFKAVFDAADTRESGVLSIQDLQEVVAQAGLRPSDKDLKMLLAGGSASDDVTFRDFLQVMVRMEDFVQPPQPGADL